MQLLIPFGVFFAVLSVLIALIQTLRRKQQITFFDLVFAFLGVLVLYSGLIVSGTDGESDPEFVYWTVLTAGGVFISGLFIILLELFRPQRLRQSRGILTLGSALLLGISSLFVPYTAAYITFPSIADDTTLPTLPVATAVAGAPTPDPTEAAQARFGQAFQQLFIDIFDIVGDETGLSLDQILTALDNGQSVAQLVSDNGGNTERVIGDVSERFRQTILTLAQEGLIPRGQAALVLSQVNFVSRLMIENDLYTLVDGFEGQDSAAATPDPNATRQSFFTFLTVTATPTGADEQVVAIVPTTTPQPTHTVIPTSTPSPTRTPRPTFTPTLTRTRFQLPTATLTPTITSPCVVLMKYNVNLREVADLESAVLATIPYETAVVASGRDERSEWWWVEYDGHSGWLKGEFVTPTASCAELPVRRD